jgi:hypothetical protein
MPRESIWFNGVDVQDCSVLYVVLEDTLRENYGFEGEVDAVNGTLWTGNPTPGADIA